MPIATGAMDVLDGGPGNHFLSGGDGADTIDIDKTDVLIASPIDLKFGPGLTAGGVTSRIGTSGGLGGRWHRGRGAGFGASTGYT
jgi:hypothetical protein